MVGKGKVICLSNYVGVGLAGKIIRTEEEYRAGRAKESHYKALFYGMFFVDILQKKPL
jgi:hypothetical protein